MSWDGISVRRPSAYEQRQVAEALRVLPAPRPIAADRREAGARAAADRASREFERRHSQNEGRYERHLVEMAMAHAAARARKGSE